MIEIVLSAVIVILLFHNLANQKMYLRHLSKLEDKLAGLETEGKVESPNEIKENHYMDIADVPPVKVIKHQ